MRVLHIGKFYPPFAGGIEHFMGDLLPALARLPDVSVAALVHADPYGHGDGGDAGVSSVEGVEVYRVPCYGRWLYAPVSPQFSLWLHRVIRRFQPDLLHLHLPNTSALWALALPAARRLPWVVHWHADVLGAAQHRALSLAYRVYRPLEQQLLARSRAVVATSQPYLDSSPPLARWRDKARVIPLGLAAARYPEPDRQSQEWAEAQWTPGVFRVLGVGRLTYYKGFDVLLRAIVGAADVQLQIVGRGEQQPALQSLAAELGVEARTRLHGFLPAPHMHALLASCDCLVLPSIERTEAFGVVLLEAMRYGKAVIATAIPGSGTGWVVQAEQSGMLVPPGDAAALTRALLRLQDDAPLRQRLGTAGAARFAEVFAIERVAEQISALYQQLLDGDASRS